ncbi:LADA_0G00232g1_1 [Lachancea dasiensis]|uniref:LADA_0G00232g1_1 n=1 Tax=Lachancea dasiensis TaxID=1072105 RepID=A0A1G4JQ40_9SACH|nr:LADA_0G00232g1_1 [Lachancea dasiensis]
MEFLDKSMGDPIQYMSNVYGYGLKNERPPFTFKSDDWEDLAKERMCANSLGYICGNAGTGETSRNNRSAFQKWSITPNRLVKTEGYPSIKSKVLGQDFATPIAVAPIGVQRIFHNDGEIAVAKAAACEKVPYIYSTAAATSIEDAATANGDGTRWYQLYWPSNEHNEITKSLLKRAQENGFSALVVTLDTYKLGWRPSDLDNGYNPFLHADTIGNALGFTDPVFRKKFEAKHGKTIEENMEVAAREWTSVIFPEFSHSWEDLQFLRENWNGPIILKGIQSVPDAKKAVKAGIDGIIVSNHGGRQQDGGTSSLDCLVKIQKAISSDIEILFDSGIRCGSDIAKALALGAKMVLIGRPYIYGLVLGGQVGVSHVLRSLLGDLIMNLHLAGIPSIGKEELNTDCLQYES